ncbi:polyprenol phosphomannose-dependent alpha 1,6 mannosyltransferase MptB [soil metagenome]
MSRVQALQRTVDGWLTGRRAVIASITTFSAVALVAATPRSPFHPVLPESQGNGPIGMLAHLFFLDRLPHGVLIVIGFTAMIAAGIAFLLVLLAAERGEVSTRTVVTLAVAYHAVVLILPLLLSRDVFSYAFYGRILSRYGQNPYVSTPADFPANDISRFVWPGWRDTPSVYGPMFVWLAAAITAVFRGLADVIEAFRAVAVMASLGSLWFVVRLVGRVRPQRQAYAAALIGLNPVVLFHTVGGGYVEVLVMLAVAAAVSLVATQRELPATVALTVGALVKISAAVPLVLLIAYVVTRNEPARRWRVLAAHVGTAMAITFVAALPFMQRSNPTLGMVELVQHGSWIAPPALVERIFEAVGSGVAGDLGGSAGVVLARLGMFAALAAGLFTIMRQVVRHAAEGSVSFLASAWGWSFLLMMLFSPTLFPWYFAWMLPVAWALPRVPRRTLELSFIALVTAQLTTENFLLPEWMHIDLAIGHPILVIVLVWFLRDLYLRLKNDVPLDAETDVVLLHRASGAELMAGDTDRRPGADDRPTADHQA